MFSTWLLASCNLFSSKGCCLLRDPASRASHSLNPCPSPSSLLASLQQLCLKSSDTATACHSLLGTCVVALRHSSPLQCALMPCLLISITPLILSLLAKGRFPVSIRRDQRGRVTPRPYADRPVTTSLRNHNSLMSVKLNSKGCIPSTFRVIASSSGSVVGGPPSRLPHPS